MEQPRNQVSIEKQVQNNRDRLIAEAQSAASAQALQKVWAEFQGFFRGTPLRMSHIFGDPVLEAIGKSKHADSALLEKILSDEFAPLSAYMAVAQNQVTPSSLLEKLPEAIPQDFPLFQKMEIWSAIRHNKNASPNLRSKIRKLRPQAKPSLFVRAKNLKRFSERAQGTSWKGPSSKGLIESRFADLQKKSQELSSAGEPSMVSLPGESSRTEIPRKDSSWRQAVKKVHPIMAMQKAIKYVKKISGGKEVTAPSPFVSPAKTDAQAHISIPAPQTESSMLATEPRIQNETDAPSRSEVALPLQAKFQPLPSSADRVRTEERMGSDTFRQNKLRHELWANINKTEDHSLICDLLKKASDQNVANSFSTTINSKAEKDVEAISELLIEEAGNTDNADEAKRALSVFQQLEVSKFTEPIKNSENLSFLAAVVKQWEDFKHLAGAIQNNPNLAQVLLSEHQDPNALTIIRDTNSELLLKNVLKQSADKVSSPSFLNALQENKHLQKAFESLAAEAKETDPQGKEALATLQRFNAPQLPQVLEEIKKTALAPVNAIASGSSSPAPNVEETFMLETSPSHTVTEVQALPVSASDIRSIIEAKNPTLLKTFIHNLIDSKMIFTPALQAAVVSHPLLPDLTASLLGDLSVGEEQARKALEVFEKVEGLKNDPAGLVQAVKEKTNASSLSNLVKVLPKYPLLTKGGKTEALHPWERAIAEHPELTELAKALSIEARDHEQGEAARTVFSQTRIPGLVAALKNQANEIKFTPTMENALAENEIVRRETIRLQRAESLPRFERSLLRNMSSRHLKPALLERSQDQGLLDAMQGKEHEVFQSFANDMRHGGIEGEKALNLLRSGDIPQFAALIEESENLHLLGSLIKAELHPSVQAAVAANSKLPNLAKPLLEEAQQKGPAGERALEVLRTTSHQPLINALLEHAVESGAERSVISALAENPSVANQLSPFIEEAQKTGPQAQRALAILQTFTPPQAPEALTNALKETESIPFLSAFIKRDVQSPAVESAIASNPHLPALAESLIEDVNQGSPEGAKALAVFRTSKLPQLCQAVEQTQNVPFLNALREHENELTPEMWASLSTHPSITEGEQTQDLIAASTSELPAPLLAPVQAAPTRIASPPPPSGIPNNLSDAIKVSGGWLMLKVLIQEGLREGPLTDSVQEAIGSNPYFPNLTSSLIGDLAQCRFDKFDSEDATRSAKASEGDLSSCPQGRDKGQEILTLLGELTPSLIPAIKNIKEVSHLSTLTKALLQYNISPEKREQLAGAINENPKLPELAKSLVDEAQKGDPEAFNTFRNMGIPRLDEELQKIHNQTFSPQKAKTLARSGSFGVLDRIQSRRLLRNILAAGGQEAGEGLYASLSANPNVSKLFPALVNDVEKGGAAGEQALTILRASPLSHFTEGLKRSESLPLLRNLIQEELEPTVREALQVNPKLPEIAKPLLEEAKLDGPEGEKTRSVLRTISHENLLQKLMEHSIAEGADPRSIESLAGNPQAQRLLPHFISEAQKTGPQAQQAIAVLQAFAPPQALEALTNALKETESISFLSAFAKHEAQKDAPSPEILASIAANPHISALADSLIDDVRNGGLQGEKALNVLSKSNIPQLTAPLQNAGASILSALLKQRNAEHLSPAAKTAIGSNPHLPALTDLLIADAQSEGPQGENALHIFRTTSILELVQSLERKQKAIPRRLLKASLDMNPISTQFKYGNAATKTIAHDAPDSSTKRKILATSKSRRHLALIDANPLFGDNLLPDLGSPVSLVGPSTSTQNQAGSRSSSPKREGR